MSDEPTLDELDSAMKEMELSGPLRWIQGTYTVEVAGKNTNVAGRFVSLQDVTSLLLETYEQALEIGWETKALDAFADEIRKVSNQ